jgi:hypothetical protein
MRRLLLVVVVICSVLGSTAYAETLVVVGVAVKKNGERVGGAKVKLCPTAKTGRVLAEDSASDRGVFSLYQNNVAGDLGDMFVIYEGAGVAEPVKVTLSPLRNGVREARTADIVVLEVAAQLTAAEAAERVAAVTKTQAILVEAGLKAEDAAKRDIETATVDVMRRVPKSELQGLTIRKLTDAEMKDFKLPTVDTNSMLKGTMDSAVQKAVTGRGGGRGGH